jgi:phenylacetate-CoA ligase
MSMTSLPEEHAEQQRWTARLRRPEPAYLTLVENEFEPEEKRAARTDALAAALIAFAAREVPHYRALLGGAKPAPGEGMKALAALPVLGKLDVQDRGPLLRAERLPPGATVSNWTQSSGTTGRPTAVLHTAQSTRMFALLKQREYRWFRFDPAAKFAAIRLPGHLPRGADGKPVPLGETLRLDTWPYMRNFATGPFAGISTTIAVEERLAWLAREQPAYLMAMSESLEFLALAAGGESPAKSIRGIAAISGQLTPGMRRFIEARFGAPVHQNYGLNEIGLVGLRCEAGRYHVHAEHCLVEIVDATGRAVLPGTMGRVVVTALVNAAMPLLRYDTGDLAEAVAGPCACGRTLPSFGEIVGRYSRIAYLPPGTAGLVNGLREAVENAPATAARGVREFQIHQYRDRGMELRVAVRGTLAPGFADHIHGVWSKIGGADVPLAIVAVDAIGASPGGKTEVFTSDFMPPREAGDDIPARGD